MGVLHLTESWHDRERVFCSCVLPPHRTLLAYLVKDVGHLAHGYMPVSKPFVKTKAMVQMKEVWTRTGLDPDDQTTWNYEQTPGNEIVPRRT